jgi:hypothetical protein
MKEWSVYQISRQVNKKEQYASYEHISTCLIMAVYRIEAVYRIRYD